MTATLLEHEPDANYGTHYSDVIMSAMASQITGVSMVCSTVCSGADQRKHQSSASLDFVWGIHRWLLDSPHKGPVTRKMFPFDDVTSRYTPYLIHERPRGLCREHCTDNWPCFNRTARYVVVNIGVTIHWLTLFSHNNVTLKYHNSLVQNHIRNWSGESIWSAVHGNLSWLSCVPSWRGHDMATFSALSSLCVGGIYWPPGPRLNIKTVLSTYGDFHVKDKTAVRTSYL